jgi:hypothetical protein
MTKFNYSIPRNKIIVGSSFHGSGTNGGGSEGMEALLLII